MDGYLAVIQMFIGNFAPRGWMFCNGQILSIAQNNALFALIGTTYGGDGITTFALPNLQARFPIHTANTIPLGQMGGEQAVTLNATQIPSHSHTISPLSIEGTAKIRASDNSANSFVAEDNALAQVTQKYTPTSPDNERPQVYSANATFAENNYLDTRSIDTSELKTVTAGTGVAGGSAAHNNMPPYLAVNFIICVEGIYPSRP